MTVWERHAERMRRQAQLERIDAWLIAHPWKARLIGVGVAIAIGEIALLLRYGLDALGRAVRP